MSSLICDVSSVFEMVPYLSSRSSHAALLEDHRVRKRSAIQTLVAEAHGDKEIRADISQDDLPDMSSYMELL
jgi:hypothetical protein